MRWPSAVCAVASLFVSANAIFTDDAFHIDYHEALLGIPRKHNTFFQKPQISSDASLLYSISDKAVLGAIRPKDGSIVWRQPLAGEPVEDAGRTYLAAGRDGTVFSGFENVVAGWDALDGRLVWDIKLPAGQQVKGLQPLQSAAADSIQVGQDVVVLAGPGKDNSGAVISRFGGAGSGVKWEHKDSTVTSDAEISIAVSSEHVFYISKSSGILGGGKAKVVVLDVSTGKELSQYSVAMDSEALGDAGDLPVGSCSGSPFLVSSEKPFKSIKLNLLGNSKITSLTLQDKGEEIENIDIHVACGSEAPAHFLVDIKSKTKHWAEVYHLNVKTGDTTKAYTLPATQESSTFAATAVGSTTYFARVTETEVQLYSSESHGQLGRWTRTATQAQHAASIAHAVVEVSVRGKSGLAVRAALTSSDGESTLIHNGDQQWSRPEMLAHTVNAVWAEDADTLLLAQDIGVESQSNPITAYVHRLSRHVQELLGLPQYVTSILTSISQPNDDAASLVREKLIGGKLVIVVTSQPKLFAIDAAHAGKIKWRLDLSKHVTAGASVVHLSVKDDRLTLITSDGSILVVNTSTGEQVEAIKGQGTFDKVVELPGTPASAIVKIDSHGIPEVFTNLAPAVPSEGNTVVTINEKGSATGWTIGSTIQNTWSIKPQGDAKFIEAISRPSHDPVASIGKVMGDRSVLYKFISPNVILLTALSSTTLTMYLINAVTGSVLHTSSHEGVLMNFPISSVLSENWFAYTFTIQDPTTSGLNTQIIISELYESEFVNDRGLLSAKANYSSFSADAGAAPFVLSQAYAISSPIANLTVTQTLQGISTRQILAVASDLKAIVSIPRNVLDARRPVDRDPTSTEAEEGLFRYAPIELDPKFFLSHSREVLGVKELMTTPTLLESTTMVFAYGHDIFGTQVSPSNTFDILGKNFKRGQLVLTVVALYVGVLFLRPLVRRKMVERRFS